LKLDPDYIESYNNLCVLYQELGEIDGAIKYCHIATSKGSGYAKAHFNLGNAYRMKGMLEEATAEYELAANLGFPGAYMNLGIIYKNMGLFDKAIEYHKHALNLRPEKAAAHLNLANAYAAKGLTDEAIKSYIAALRLRPDFVQAHESLARAYRKKGLYERADEHSRIAENLKQQKTR
jgi:tetratricopeptide (TPR) repeat protein